MRTLIHFFTKRSFRVRQKTYKVSCSCGIWKNPCLVLKMLCWLKMQVWFFPGQTNCYQSFEMLVISPFILIPKTHCVVLLLYALTKRRQTKAKKKIGLPFKCKQNKAIHFLDISRWLCPMVLNDRFSQLLISFTVRNTCWVVSILIVLPILTAQFQASTPSRHGFVYIQSNIILYKKIVIRHQ